MSDLILIKNPRQCPQCAAKGSIRRDQRRCCECGARLFTPEDNFKRIAEDWILGFWVFFPVHNPGTFRGWVNSAHLKSPAPVTDPVEIKDPGKDYGRVPNAPRPTASRTTQELGAESLTPKGSN